MEDKIWFKKVKEITEEIRCQAGKESFDYSSINTLCVRFHLFGTIAQHYHVRNYIHKHSHTSVMVSIGTKNYSSNKVLPKLLLEDEINEMYDNDVKFWAFFSLVNRAKAAEIVLHRGQVLNLLFHPVEDLDCFNIGLTAAEEIVRQRALEGALDAPHLDKGDMDELEW